MPLAAPRVGIGYDSHRIAKGGTLLLGGIEVATGIHLEGHSDADAVAHALTDAILGAAAAGDIGSMFPDTDAANRGRNSIEMLAAALMQIRSLGHAVVNVDITVVAENVKIAPHRDSIRSVLAAVLGVGVDAVSIKGKTNEAMGWIGRGEGLAVIAVAMVGPVEAGAP